MRRTSLYNGCRREKKAALKLPSSVNKPADDDKMSDDASVFDQAIDFA